MHPLRKKRLLLIGLMLLVVSVAVGLVLFALKSNVDYFFPPADIAAGKAPIDKRIRVGGMVVEHSIQRDPMTLKVRFKLTDYADELSVVYEGILPDLFAEKEGAVASGKLGADGVFVADEVLAKHDENYMPPEVADSLVKQGKAAPSAATARDSNNMDAHKLKQPSQVAP
ncbi:MAG: cytochrome c maturation protein CcmE [Pseudomonadota bacterium]